MITLPVRILGGALTRIHWRAVPTIQLLTKTPGLEMAPGRVTRARLAQSSDVAPKKEFSQATAAASRKRKRTSNIEINAGNGDLDGSPMTHRGAIKEDSSPSRTPVPKRNRQSATIKSEDVANGDHSLRRSSRSRRSVDQQCNRGDEAAPTAMKSTPRKKVKIEERDATDFDAKMKTPPSTAKKPKSPRTKANPYGLTPGTTPFPDWPGPTSEMCEEVTRLLSKLHGVYKAPDKIPAPSLDVAGCGEVPSILDALIRTLLSANTTNTNSSRAFQGLVKAFGVVEDGIGKGSVNWNNVRLAPVEDVIEAIKSGGLAKVKSNNIKKILNMVYEENQARRAAYLEEKKTGSAATNIIGAGDKTQGQKDLEILKTESEILSLDHIHGMAPDEAMLELIKFPGIGVKTSSCVVLFCMQQPSFAVDTHVWRLCKWLKWVPPTATRDQTFSHCEVRVPDHLKYPLHRLLIRHGKTCGRCRAITGEGSEGWADANCPIEHLVERTGKKKGNGGTPTASPAGKKAQGRGTPRRAATWDPEEEDDETPELSDHPSDDLAD